MGGITYLDAVGSSGLTLKEAGEAAGGMTAAAVDVAIKRLVERAAGDRPLRAHQKDLLNLIDSGVEYS